MAFLAFEGIDAAGKSTLMAALARQLERRGHRPLKSREPGGTALGRKIRKILLESSDDPPAPMAEILLYYADRSQHIERVLEPALKQGRWALSDRFWASTSAYQQGGRGAGADLIPFLKKAVCGACQPDLLILLDLPVEEALRRMEAARKGEKDRMEGETPGFHQKVRDFYLNLAAGEPSRWLVLDALKPPRQLLEETLARLRKMGLTAGGGPAESREGGGAE